MTIDNLEQRIEQLSDQDRKLLLYKLEEIISSTTISNTSKPKRLVAYIKRSEHFDLKKLNTFLKTKLPDYMIPSAIYTVEEIPLLPNGKIDRKGLKKISKKHTKTTRVNTENKNTLNSDTEKQLTKLWEEVLGVKPIYKDDNFFEIGGDSILSIQIVSKARKLGLNLTTNQLFEHQTISELASSTKIQQKTIQTEEKPDDIEKKLIAIWEEVLQNKPIYKDDNFFEIGGDSILSIQIIAKARKSGLTIKANQIFENQTISELSKVIKQNSDVTTEKVSVFEISEEIPLTPIQHWFFENHLIAPHYWNQIFEIQNINTGSSETLKSIAEELVTNYEALRLSFSKTSDKWTSNIKLVGDLNPYYSSKLETNSIAEQEQEIEQKLIEIQNNIKLSEGNLFKIIDIDCNSVQPNKVILLAHHLVVDMVSWNIIFNYIKQRVNNNLELASELSPSATIKDWAIILNELHNTTSYNELSYWKAQQNTNEIFPVDFSSDKTTFSEDEIFSYTRELNVEDSSKLIQEANKAYKTKIDDLLIAALLMSMGKWSKSKSITLGLEKQGRTLHQLDKDFSNTVGWFTSYFPVKLDCNNIEDTESHIKVIKEQLRAIPNNGLGFGILKYFTKKNEAILNEIAPKIVFNYLGKSNLNNASSQVSFQSKYENCARHPKSERTYSIEINAYIINQQLKINWSFARALYSETTAETLVESFTTNLNKIITHCTTKDSVGYTPSDFSDVDINQDDLDNLLNQL